MGYRGLTQRSLCRAYEKHVYRVHCFEAGLNLSFSGIKFVFGRAVNGISTQKLILHRFLWYWNWKLCPTISFYNMKSSRDDLAIESGSLTMGLGMNFVPSIDASRVSSSKLASRSFSLEPIDSSNIGFQLLKKHGWKEGTGLGVSEQGMLEPVEAHVKKNKRGLGAEKVKKEKVKSGDVKDHFDKIEKPLSKRQTKSVSKKLRKMQELEKKLKEREFDRAFFREFWPDNV